MENNNTQSKVEGEKPDFDQKLAIEILARFTGSSRGTPIAKQAFIDGAIWANQTYFYPLHSRIKALEQELEKERREGRQEWERLQVSTIDQLQVIIKELESSQSSPVETPVRS